MPRVAVVTGSNRGIGPAMVRALQKVGYAVVSNGRSAMKGPGDLHVRADVATPTGARKLIATARKRYGRLDLLVNNVGIFRETAVSEMDLDGWEEIFDSNLRSAWHCCREALPLLRRRKGAVINFGSPMAHMARANPRIVAYQMAKTALAVFTKSLAQAEARRGLRVNMISPGYIRTHAYAKSEIADLTRKVPAGRLGTPEDMAQAVVWLASDAAAYVNGAIIDIGGGLWI
jgi:3-oxoacyl-[acyl-carrier protein] reductase